MRTTVLSLWLSVYSLWVHGEPVASNSPPPDLLIVGAGISGLCAALEAARAGATVTVIDMGSVFGGHAVMSSGMVCLVNTPEQRANGVADSVKLACRDFIRFGEDADPGWVRFYVNHSMPEVYGWLLTLGVTDWELYPQVIPGNTVRRQHLAKGRGMGLVSPIYMECLQYPNLTFVWNTRATGMIRESGRVVGVRGVHQRTGQAREFRGASVILATGGFESNLELVRANWPRYFPGLASDTRLLLGSGINAVGSGLELAGNAGAALARRDHQLFYSTGLVDPRDATGSRGLHAFNRLAIWVNAQGQRFVADGQPDPKLQMPAVLRQKPACYWAVFDAASRPEFFVSGSDWKDTDMVQREIFENPKLAQWVKRADTLEDLAQAAALPVSNLTATVRHWNHMVEHGTDLDFQRFDISSPERPPKIDTPPFYAVQLFPLARKSLGGVAVDLSCRVLDRNRKPLPGLYAVGELAGVGGINGKAALEGTMLGPGILMGRVAAKHAVAQVRHKLNAPVPKAQIKPAMLSPPATVPDTLGAWREVLRQLVSHSRPGYLHFEKAHGVVLDRHYDCVLCHRETSPLAITEEQLDRRGLIAACPRCHGGVTE